MDKPKESTLRRSLRRLRTPRRLTAENQDENDEQTHCTRRASLNAVDRTPPTDSVGPPASSTAASASEVRLRIGTQQGETSRAGSTTMTPSHTQEQWEHTLESYFNRQKASEAMSNDKDQQDDWALNMDSDEEVQDPLQAYVNSLSQGSIPHRLATHYHNFKAFDIDFDPVEAVADLGMTIQGNVTFPKLKPDTPSDIAVWYIQSLAEKVAVQNAANTTHPRPESQSSDSDWGSFSLSSNPSDRMNLGESPSDRERQVTSGTTSADQPPTLIHPHQITHPTRFSVRSFSRQKRDEVQGVNGKSKAQKAGDPLPSTPNGAIADFFSSFQRKRRRTSSSPEHSEASTPAAAPPPHTAWPSGVPPLPDLLAGMRPAKGTTPVKTIVQRMLDNPELRARLLPYLDEGTLQWDELVASSLSPEEIERYAREFYPMLKKIPKLEVQGIMPPKLHKIRTKETLWFSELIPRKFSRQKRVDLLRIFHEKVSYVPLAVCGKIGTRLPITYYVQTKSQTKYPNGRPSDLPLGVGRRGWPALQIPTEIFEHVADYLPRESLQAMRLVNTEFESKVSNRLFHTVVVPFREEIYGFLQQPAADLSPKRAKSKGKGKAKAAKEATSAAEEKILHDGMKVFEAWGRNIQRFALAFEVDEAALEAAPKKGRFEKHQTYWGDYKWPHPFYFRYESIETLEKKADEFKCMSQALSYLVRVSDLGLCLDSGLGWLTGPDKSDRERLLQQKSEVFGRANKVPDIKQVEQHELWEDLLQTVALAKDGLTVHTAQNDSLDVVVELKNQRKKVKLLDHSTAQENHPLVFEAKEIAIAEHDGSNNNEVRFPREGLVGSSKSTSTHYSGITLKPNALTEAQLEWLLETDWAQRAFLSSFCMALSDNATTFSNVHTLNISKISSRYLRSLQRDDVWQGLPNVKTLTIKVSPDWRDIVKTDAGLVCSPTIKPSESVGHFYALLSDSIRKLRNIKTLTLSYVGGGEHQPGIFARNRFVLPAPICSYSSADSPVKAAVDMKFPHVTTLTLENMWLTPYQLRAFARGHSNLPLRHLVLSSVSLTALTASNVSNALNFTADDEAYDIAQGPPRRGDPSCAEYLQNHRAWNTPDPDPDGWITEGVRRGSWADVLDTITPGATVAFLRWIFNYRDELPELNRTNLQTLTLHSCGYIHLPHLDTFQQHTLSDLSTQHGTIPASFTRRASDLFPVMMYSADELLGNIISAFPGEEAEFWHTGPAQMVLGRESWAGIHNGGAVGDVGKDRRGEAWQCVEDGQPFGGEGRISGVVKKLHLPVQNR